MSAELSARRTAAAAAAADFHAAAVAFQRGGEQPDYAVWAQRLERHLLYVLDALAAGDTGRTAAQTQPAPGTLRSELEATVRTWREESEPYPGEDAAEVARRGGFGYCADELAQVLERHPQQPAPGDVGYLGSDALAKRYGDALQRIVDADPSDAVDKLARNALGLTRVPRPKPQPTPELAEVRAVLGAFTWGVDDLQCALEKIDAIVNRSRS